MTARLTVADVTCRFGGLRALDGVSLTVEPGTILGVIGPNGAGKSTFVNVVSGQITPTDDRVVEAYLGERFARRRRENPDG